MRTSLIMYMIYRGRTTGLVVSASLTAVVVVVAVLEGVLELGSF